MTVETTDLPFANVAYLKPGIGFIKGEMGFFLSRDYRAALEAVERDRPVRVMEGERIWWQGTAGEMLDIAR